MLLYSADKRVLIALTACDYVTVSASLTFNFNGSVIFCHSVSESVSVIPVIYLSSVKVLSCRWP